MPSEKYVTEDEMLVLLRKVYKEADEEQVTLQLGRWIADPVQPVNAKGRLRVHPLLLALVLVVSAVIAALVCLVHSPL